MAVLVGAHQQGVDVKKLAGPDYQYMTDNDLALKDWWDKPFKGGW